MAKEPTIHKILTKIAANYSKRAGWPEEVFSVWLDGLRHMPDRLLFDAAKRWMADNHRAPTVANIRNTAKSLQPSIGEHRPKGCARCDGSGWVEIAHHLSSKSGGESRVNTYSAACDCSAGYRLQNGPAVPWKPFVEQLRGDPYTLQVFHSTPAKPKLDKWERTSPEALERLNITRTSSPHLGAWQSVSAKF